MKNEALRQRTRHLSGGALGKATSGWNTRRFVNSGFLLQLDCPATSRSNGICHTP